MKKVSHNNLQEFCRVCLTYIPKRNERRVLRNSSGGKLGNDKHSKDNVYDLNLLPQLREIFASFTSTDVSMENEEVYPQSLCQSCYDKMIVLQDLRNLANNSAQAVFEVVNDDDNSNKRKSQKTGSSPKYKKPRLLRSSQGNDDALPLPASGPLLGYSIKAERQDSNKVGVSSSDMMPPNDDRKDNLFKPLVKKEYSSECQEDDKDPPLIDANDSNEHIMVDGNGDLNTSNSQKENEADNTDSLKSGVKKKFLICPFCPQKARRQVYLDAHIRRVHDGHENSFLCDECQMSFKYYNQLQAHRIKSKHFVEKTFKCGINGCDASFKQSQTLEAHRKVEHSSSNLFGFQEILELHQLQFNELQDGRWFCQICLKNYSSRFAFKVHLERHSGIKSYICKVCGIGKVTKAELVSHMRMHESKPEIFKCSYCPQKFKYEQTMVHHMRTIHEERKFACVYCSKSFCSSYAQKCHERQVHTGERPYVCNVCNKGFAKINTLYVHRKSHNKKLPKNVCSICSQRFPTKTHLIAHEKRHQGPKPHLCNICGRGYFTADILDAHKQSHTEEEKNRAELKRGGIEASEE